MARLEGKSIADYYHSQGQNSLWAVYSLTGLVSGQERAKRDLFVGGGGSILKQLTLSFPLTTSNSLHSLQTFPIANLLSPHYP